MLNKTVIVTHRNRIAPVFDVAENGLLLEIGSDGAINRRSVRFEASTLEGKVRQLEDWGVKTLLCGAVSRFARELIESKEIVVYGFLAGGTDEIVEAWSEGLLSDMRFRMPGCGRGRCGERCRRHGLEGGHYARWR